MQANAKPIRAIWGYSRAGDLKFLAQVSYLSDTDSYLVQHYVDGIHNSVDDKEFLTQQLAIDAAGEWVDSIVKDDGEFL